MEQMETNFGIRVTVEEVTPARAREYLSHEKDKNRPVSLRIVDQYMRLMLANNWWSIDTLKFGTDGRLLDGQHRLMALDKGNLTMRMICAWGCPEEAMTTMDSGRPRTLADQLYLADEPNYRELSSALYTHYCYLHADGRLSSTYLRTGEKGWTWELPSPFELLWHLDQHPRIRGGLTLSRMVDRVMSGGRGRWTAIHYILGDIDVADRDYFFDKLVTGAGLEVRSPILMLREQFGRAAQRRPGAPGVTHNEFWGAVFKAWNLFRKGETGNIVYRPGGKVREPWPKLV